MDYKEEHICIGKRLLKQPGQSSKSKQTVFLVYMHVFYLIKRTLPNYSVTTATTTTTVYMSAEVGEREFYQTKRYYQGSLNNH